jgi:hypothetical protein
MSLPTSVDDPNFTLWLTQILEGNGVERQKRSSVTLNLRNDHTVEQLKKFMKKNNISHKSKDSKQSLQEAIFSHYKNQQPIQLPEHILQILQIPNQSIPVNAFHPVQYLPQVPIQEQPPFAFQIPPQIPTQVPFQEQPQVLLQEQPPVVFQEQPPILPQIPLIYIPINQPIETIKKKSKEEYKKIPIPKPLRLQVWEKFFPRQMYGNCICCQREMCFDTNYECSHIIAEREGGATVIDNLVPACQTCNRSMRTRNLYEFQKMFISRKAVMVSVGTQTETLEMTIRFDQLKIVA